MPWCRQKLVQQFHFFYTHACAYTGACTNIVCSKKAHAASYSLLFRCDGFNAIRKKELFMP